MSADITMTIHTVRTFGYGPPNQDVLREWSGPIPAIGSKVDGHLVVDVDQSFYSSQDDEGEYRSSGYVEVYCEGTLPT